MDSTVDELQVGDAVFAPLGAQTVAELPAVMVRKLNHFDRAPEAEVALAGWLAEGRLVMDEQYEHGIDRFGHAVRMLLTGGNRGKMLLDLR